MSCVVTPELTLRELLPKLTPVDLVIVEGYKTTTPRKIEVHRVGNGKPLLYPGDPAIVGIATDSRRGKRIAVGASRRHRRRRRDGSQICDSARRCARPRTAGNLTGHGATLR